MERKKGYTTVEEGRRLLACGLHADTADCYYDIVDSDDEKKVWWLPDGKTYSEHTGGWREIGVTFPCWSAGRLMEMLSEEFDVLSIPGRLMPCDFTITGYLVSNVEAMMEVRKVKGKKFKNEHELHE